MKALGEMLSEWDVKFRVQAAGAATAALLFSPLSGRSASLRLPRPIRRRRFPRRRR